MRYSFCVNEWDSLGFMQEDGRVSHTMDWMSFRRTKRLFQKYISDCNNPKKFKEMIIPGCLL